MHGASLHATNHMNSTTYAYKLLCGAAGRRARTVWELLWVVDMVECEGLHSNPAVDQRLAATLKALQLHTEHQPYLLNSTPRPTHGRRFLQTFSNLESGNAEVNLYGALSRTHTPQMRYTACRTSAPISINQSSAKHQLTLRDHGYVLVHHVVCLFTPRLSLVFIAPTHGGMARLSRPVWLVLHRDGLPALRRLPIQVVTGPGVAQLRCSRPMRYH